MVKCKYCVYWRSDDQEVGYCHRNAPLLRRGILAEVFGKRSIFKAIWPRTFANDECGAGSRTLS